MSEELKELNGAKEMLQKILLKPVKPEVFVSSDNISEAIFEQKLGNRPIASRFKARGREDFIFNALGHLPADPSNAETADILHNTYLFPDNSNTINNEVVNHNKASAETLLEDLRRSALNEARREYSPEFGMAGRHRQLFLLTGARGVGKTIFINYLFSINTPMLDEKTCLWVRLNMIDTFGGINPDLEHWSAAKIALVVLRHYNNESAYCSDPKKHIPILERLYEWIEGVEKKDLKLAYDYRDKLLGFIKKVQTSEIVAIIPDDIPKQLAIAVRDILKEFGYYFIYIIDGLDRLELSPRYQKRFNKILEILRVLINKDIDMCGTYLLVARIESKNEIENHLKWFDQLIHNIDIRHKTIESVRFKDIFEKRINYIIDTVNKDGNKKGWDLSDWPGHIREFQDNVLIESEVENLNEYTQKLRDVFSNNHRAKVQLNQISYYYYVNQTKIGKAYTMIELMCKGGFKYPVAPTYAILDKGGLAVFPPDRLYDTIFLPNIFHYPYGTGLNIGRTGYAHSPLLAGLRVLQLIRADESWRGDFGIKDARKCKQLGDIIQHIFDYDRELIYSILLLFSEYEIVNLNGMPFYVKAVASYEIHGMPKLIFILNVAIKELAYLNMCAMRAPIARGFLASNPLISAACLEEKADIDDWAIIKIFNAIRMFQILSTINQQEKDQVMKRYQQNKIPEKSRLILDHALARNWLFEVFDEDMAKLLIDQIQRMFVRMGTKGQREFFNNLKKIVK